MQLILLSYLLKAQRGTRKNKTSDRERHVESHGYRKAERLRTQVEALEQTFKEELYFKLADDSQDESQKRWNKER